MITKEQYKEAMKTLEDYEEQRIKLDDVKKGDCYKHNGSIFRATVYFDRGGDRVWYSWEDINNFKIEDGEIHFWTNSRSDKEILSGEKLKQIKGKELERLQYLNDLAYNEYLDIDSKDEEYKLEKEREELASKCCHDWDKDDTQIRCKVCEKVVTV